MSGPIIHFPTEAESKDAAKHLAAMFRQQREVDHSLALDALDALPVLIAAMRNKTGQSYKLRSLLFSLWNGKPASLLEVVNLDRSLRFALDKVVLAFGSNEFFYNQLSEPLKAAGLFDWFCEEGEVVA